MTFSCDLRKQGRSQHAEIQDSGFSAGFPATAMPQNGDKLGLFLKQKCLVGGVYGTTTTTTKKAGNGVVTHYIKLCRKAKGRGLEFGFFRFNS